MGVEPKPLKPVKSSRHDSKAPPIYVVSSSMGSLGERIARTVLPQFHGADVSVKIMARVQHVHQVEQVIAEAKQTNATIIHTIANPDLRRVLIQHAEEHDVFTIDAVGPLIDRLTEVLGQEPIGKPGLYRELNEPYFKRIEAIEFTIAHDDGKQYQDWPAAEIVLTGLSRVGKTPLSLYLSMLGWKVANVPIVPGISPRPELFALKAHRVFGLRIDPARLLYYREYRQRGLGVAKSDYNKLEKLYEEADEARRVFRKGGFRVIDVTNKPIETTAGQVIQLVTRHLDNWYG